MKPKGKEAADSWRRLRRVLVSPQLIAGVLRTGNTIHVRIAEGLPEGTEVLSVSTDPAGNCSILVRHPSFEKLESQSALPPEHRVMVRTLARER